MFDLQCNGLEYWTNLKHRVVISANNMAAEPEREMNPGPYSNTYM